MARFYSHGELANPNSVSQRVESGHVRLFDYNVTVTVLCTHGKDDAVVLEINVWYLLINVKNVSC